MQATLPLGGSCRRRVEVRCPATRAVFGTKLSNSRHSAARGRFAENLRKIADKQRFDNAHICANGGRNIERDCATESCTICEVP